MAKEGKAKHNIRVFLSSASEDEYANRLARILRDDPFITVFSHRMLTAGEDWQSKILKALSQSDVFLLTPRSLESKWVLQELGAALSMGKRVLAIGEEDVLSNSYLAKVPELKILTIKDPDNPESRRQLVEAVLEEVA